MKQTRNVAIAMMSAVLLLLECGVASAQTTTYYAYTEHDMVTNPGTVTPPGIMILGGYYNVGDGGGGTFLVGSNSGCVPNGGTIFSDNLGYCYTRLNPTNSVREWGAYCDVTALQPALSGNTATWQPTLTDPHNTSFHGALVVASSLLNSPPVAGEYIAISQVGASTLWTNASGSAAKPGMSATRFSILSATGTNYAPGDLVSFIGPTNPGSFSQQIAIIVDAVDIHGAITKWHFLWGGLYDSDPAIPQIGSSLVQDTNAGHNYLQNSGAGAMMSVAWSGWSLLNNQNIATPGANYVVGETITMSASTSDGSVVNQSHYPVLVVEATDNSGGTGIGGVVTYDWLDYGSYSTLPTSPLTLTSVVSSGPGHGFSISQAQWTQGPLVSKIDAVVISALSGLTSIYLSEDFTSTPRNAFPANMNVQSFYYGHDDGARINSALISQSATSIATGDGAAFTLPAACGTTLAINLPQDATANYVNPSLIGGNFQSTGLYAFAAPLTSRYAATGGTPVLSRVIYSGLANAAGGGFRDMEVQAMGVPEGYGYYGMANIAHPPGAPAGYVGPPASGSTPPLAPTAGDAVEIDSGPSMRIDNVHVANGGIGSGNAVVQCGIDESDPTGLVRGAALSKIMFTDSRLDGEGIYPNPDVTLRLANSCHGSTFQALSVYDGTKADVLEYNNNLFSQIHLNSDAAGSSTSLDPTLVFTSANSRFAGVADYGFYAIGSPTVMQTQCDIANLACVFVLPPTTPTLFGSGPGQITDTQMKCGHFPGVPPNYLGVELTAGVTNTTVSGTASSGRCNVPPAQLVVLDGTPDQTVSVCNNTNAPLAYCSGYEALSGFAHSPTLPNGRFYTQPSLGYANVPLSGTATSTTIYAMPFINPTGGMITRIGIQVTMSGGTGSLCDLGIYASLNGAPSTLVLNGGNVSVNSAMMKSNGGLNFSVQPNTLYFLALACNASPSVKGTTNTGGFIGLLMGEPDFTTFGGATNITATWPTFSASSLPTTFPAPIVYGAAGTATTTPNVYVGPT